MNIPYEWYKVFYHAANQRNYTKASELLFVSQSAVSQTIRQLEMALKVQLFYKEGRQIKLTREGEVLFDHVSPAVKLLQKGEDTLKSHSSLEKGSIKLGASDTISRFLLLPFIKQFHEEHPEILLTINNRPSPISSELVQKGEIDFAIVNYEITLETQRLEVIPLIEAENVFVATRTYLKEHGLLAEKISVKKLSKCPLITLEPKSTTRRLLDRFLADRKITWSPEFEGGSVDLILEMASLGIGLGFVPKMALSKWHDENLCIIPLAEKIPTTAVCIVKHPQMPLSPAASACLASVKAHFLI